jgi:hypothetical protein
MNMNPFDRRRRFPAPWAIRETDASVIVVDSNGRTLAYLYFEDSEQRRSATNLLTREEARRIGRGIARLPELITKEKMRSS